MSQTERVSMAAWIRGASERAGRRGGRQMRVQRVRLRDAMVEGGMEADGRGRHAVAQVLQWRGGHRSREALVRWEGFDVSADGGGAAWEDSWVPRSRLTADLREAGRLRPYAPRKRRSDAAAEAAVASQAEGTRRSARLAGGRLEVVEYVGGERVVVRRGGAGTAQMHAGAADGDVVDMGE